MIRQFIPTTTEAINAWVFTCLILGILVGLLAAAYITEWLSDRVVAKFFAAKRSATPDGAERRRLSAIVARREGQN